MKSLFLAASAVFTATAAFAGEPIIEQQSASSGTAAVLLLVVLGVVIASSGLGATATRGKTDMDIDPTDIDDSIGH